MRITKLETIFVKPRWLFLKVHTDAGIVGWGEPVVEGRSQTVAAAVHEIGRYLIGQDPMRIEHHWQAIYRGAFYRGGPVLTSALSGVEQALWDIKGKALGVPVYELLGGAVRDRIRIYGHIGGETPEQCVASRHAPPWPRALPRSRPACRAGGADRGPAERGGGLRRAHRRRARGGRARRWTSASTFHGRISPAMAVRLAKALEPYHPLFIEEPCLPENVDTMVTVARSTTIPIATGERLFTKWGFREVLEKQAAVILQPDLSHAGGILECKKIAAMAEVYYAAIAPHCPLGPIALAACLQLDACTPNFLCQEQVNLGEGYLKEPFVVKNGLYRPADRAGPRHRGGRGGGGGASSMTAPGRRRASGMRMARWPIGEPLMDKRYDLVTLGETMIRLSPPPPQRLEQATVLEINIGGAESNVAVALARLGFALPGSPACRRTSGASGWRRRCARTRWTWKSIVWAPGERIGTYFVEYGRAPRPIQVLYDRADSAMSRMRVAEVPWEVRRGGADRALHRHHARALALLRRGDRGGDAPGPRGGGAGEL